MKISQRYIDSAILIRKKYLNELEELNKKEKQLIVFNGQLIELMTTISDNKNLDKNYISTKISDMNKNINLINDNVLNIKKNINKLKKDADILYDLIIEKYPHLKNQNISDIINPYINF